MPSFRQSTPGSATSIEMKILLLLAAVVVAVRADCDACIKGWCHYQETLIEGFLVTDQMAIDQKNDILYVQLNHNLNTAYHLREHRIRLVQTLNTTGMTVDQTTQILYTAHGDSIFKITVDGTAAETVLDDNNFYIQPHSLLSYGDYLYYVDRKDHHLCVIKHKTSYYYNHKFIADSLVSLQNGDVYVSANSTVYLVHSNHIYIKDFRKVTELKTFKSASLSNYKNNVYVTDASANVIYKINETGALDEYAAYETGSVGQVVFDSNSSIVFHDTATGSVKRWQRGQARCTIEMQHKYIINKLPLETPDDDDDE